MKGARTVWTSAAVVLGCLHFGSVQTIAQSDKSAGSLRTPWQEPDLRGVWQGAALGASPGQDRLNLISLERLYRPEARANMKELSAKDDPTLQCGPPAFPRAASMGTPIQILQKPKFALVLSEAFHSFRNIPTDGREHISEDFRIPFTMGDSTGHWEGDTLVVDVISFKGDTWLAGGQDKPTRTSTGVWPTSDAMHVIERWRRVDAGTLEYQARVEDPMMLTGPWQTPKIILKRLPITRVQEVKCLRTDPASPPEAYLKQFGR